MKAKIHPKYYKEAKVVCACGNSWTTGSTKPELNVEICASCHPFFTGKANLLDTAGRVDRFKARLARSKKFAGAAEKRKLKKEQVALANSAKNSSKKDKRASKSADKKSN